MMGGRAMGPPMMMRMMFALMDSDGDGTIELPEFQAAHERNFVTAQVPAGIFSKIRHFERYCGELTRST